MSKSKLFIGNLSWKVTEDHLRPLFEQYGSVVKVNVVYDGYTHKSRGFGFVEMGSPEEAQEVLEKLNGYVLAGRPLRISLAEDRREGTGGGMRRENSPGAGMRRGG